MVQSQQTILKSGKTKFMCFRPRQKRMYIDFKISIGNKEISQDKETSLWGVSHRLTSHLEATYH